MPQGLRAAYLSVLGPPALIAPLPLFWTHGASPFAIALYEAALLLLFVRARAGRPIQLSDAVLNAIGLSYFFWLAVETAMLRPGLLRSVSHLLLFTTIAKLASLKRPGEARTALLVIFLLVLAAISSSTHVASLLLLRGDGLSRLPDALPARGAGRLRRGAPDPSARGRAHPGAVGCRSPGRSPGGGAALLPPAAPSRALRALADPHGRRAVDRSRHGPRGPRLVWRGEAERSGHPAALDRSADRHARVAPAARSRLHPIPKRRLDPKLARGSGSPWKRGSPTGRRGLAARRRPARAPVHRSELLRERIPVPALSVVARPRRARPPRAVRGRLRAGLLDPVDCPLRAVGVEATRAGRRAEQHRPRPRSAGSARLRLEADGGPGRPREDRQPDRHALPAGFRLHARSPEGQRRPAGQLSASIEGRPLRVLRLCRRSDAGVARRAVEARDRIVRRRGRSLLRRDRRPRSKPPRVGRVGSGRLRFPGGRADASRRGPARDVAGVLVATVRDRRARTRDLLRPADPRFRFGRPGPAHRSIPGFGRQRRPIALVLEGKRGKEFSRAGRRWSSSSSGSPCSASWR